MEGNKEGFVFRCGHTEIIEKGRPAFSCYSCGDFERFYERLYDEIGIAVYNTYTVYDACTGVNQKSRRWFWSYSKVLCIPLFKYASWGGRVPDGESAPLYFGRIKKQNVLDLEITIKLKNGKQEVVPCKDVPLYYFEQAVKQSEREEASRGKLLSWLWFGDENLHKKLHKFYQSEDIVDIDIRITGITLDLTTTRFLYRQFNRCSYDAAYASDREIITTRMHSPDFIKNPKTIQLIRFVYLVRVLAHSEDSDLLDRVNILINDILENKYGDIIDLADERETFSHIRDYICNIERFYIDHNAYYYYRDMLCKRSDFDPIFRPPNMRGKQEIYLFQVIHDSLNNGESTYLRYFEKEFYNWMYNKVFIADKNNKKIATIEPTTYGGGMHGNLETKE